MKGIIIDTKSTDHFQLSVSRFAQIPVPVRKDLWQQTIFPAHPFILGYGCCHSPFSRPMPAIALSRNFTAQ
jgi:hypothetical protein